jgi:hypothetical protein
MLSSAFGAMAASGQPRSNGNAERYLHHLSVNSPLRPLNKDEAREVTGMIRCLAAIVLLTDKLAG